MKTSALQLTSYKEDTMQKDVMDEKIILTRLQELIIPGHDILQLARWNMSKHYALEQLKAGTLKHVTVKDILWMKCMLEGYRDGII